MSWGFQKNKESAFFVTFILPSGSFCSVFNLLQQKDQEQQDPKRISSILTYSRFLPNLTAVVRKNWNILQTNKSV